MADDFGKKVERFGQGVWKKTQDTFGVIGKNSEISSKSRDLRMVYAEIGRQYCDKHAAETDNEFAELTTRAQQMAEEIAELEAQVLAQKGCRKCVSCGESIPAASAFCPHCGAAQPKEEPPVVEESFVSDNGWICPNCGERADGADLFCSSCGTKRP